jgi:two-component system OmpR family sensor kinase
VRARLRPSTISARLALSIALVLLVVLAALGVVLAQVARYTLTDQIDDQVLGAAAQAGPRRPPGSQPPPPPPPKPEGQGPVGKPGGGPGAFEKPGAPPPVAAVPKPSPKPTAEPPPPPSAPPLPDERIDPSGRLVAVFVYTPDGRLVTDAPSGFAGRPDPPPDLPAVPSPEIDRLADRIMTVPAVDRSLMYRVLIRKGPRGETFVIAGSLRMVDSAVARLVEALLLGGLAALAAATLACIWLIRRGLAPVSHMIDAAAEIAAGDYTRRVPDLDPASELGRLGAALNEMLAQIERGIQARLANEERLRRFVADAAHELRTPLTSLRGYAELYRQGACPDEESVNHVMRRIAAEGARMGRLVDDLLLLARLDHHQGIEWDRVDMVALARDAVADFRVVQPDRPVTAQLDGSAVVLGDRGRLHQVIDNLLTNARTHTPPGTPVRVSIAQLDGHVDLTVADEGPGIAVEDQPRIFERFWRGDPSRVRRTGGTGLGLAIVASLVQAHGGTIELVSAPSQGAAFTVRLPLAREG